MSRAVNKVVRLHPQGSSAALESLNRITGLQFSRWPQSLVAVPAVPAVPAGQALPLDAEPDVPGLDQAFA